MRWRKLQSCNLPLVRVVAYRLLLAHRSLWRSCWWKVRVEILELERKGAVDVLPDGGRREFKRQAILVDDGQYGDVGGWGRRLEQVAVGRT